MKYKRKRKNFPFSLRKFFKRNLISSLSLFSWYFEVPYINLAWLLVYLKTSNTKAIILILYYIVLMLRLFGRWLYLYVKNWASVSHPWYMTWLILSTQCSHSNDGMLEKTMYQIQQRQKDRKKRPRDTWTTVTKE